MEPISRLIVDPVFVVDAHGRVLDCNRHAKSLMATLGSREPLSALDDRFRRLIESASGTSEPVLGSLVLSDAGASRPYRARAVCDRSTHELRFAIQILHTQDDQFVVLASRVKELNKEVAHRRTIQARLEETLSQNSILYRELQHRVKNQLQMTLGFFTAARRQTRNDEALTIIAGLESKLQIVFAAQRLMYEQNSAGVDARALLESMVNVLSALTAEDVVIALEAAEVHLENEIALPVALIANELISNAIKYGVPNGGNIRVTLAPRDRELELEVRDWGPGFVDEVSKRRSSGLGLIRGLCRQIGGQLKIDAENGVVARVRFPATSHA